MSTTHSCHRAAFAERDHQVSGRENRVREGRTIEFMSCAHHFPAERRRGILHQRDMKAEYHSEAAG